MEREINLKNLADDLSKTISKKNQKNIGDIVYTKAIFENILSSKAISKTGENSAKIVSGPSSDSIEIKRKRAVSQPSIMTFMGIKIDMSEKKDSYIIAFKKFYVESKSHNLLLRAYAGAKAGFYSMALSLLGVSREELGDFKKEAGAKAIEKNMALFNENENASELGKIAGGSKKYLKAQEKVTSEIRNQLIIQCENLGLKGYFTPDKIIEIKIEQCRDIGNKLLEEKTNLEYQLRMAQLGVSLNETSDEVDKKIKKIDQLMSRIEMRITSLGRDLEKIKIKTEAAIKGTVDFQKAGTY